MDGDDLPGKIQGFLAQGLEKVAETAMRQSFGKMREARIGLEQQHDSRQFVAPGQREAFLQPGKDDRVALEKFLPWFTAPAVIVVIARQVERDEKDRAAAETRVLAVGTRLAFERDSFSPQRIGLFPEKPA